MADLVWDQGSWDVDYWAPSPSYELISDLIQLKYDLGGLASKDIQIKYDVLNLLSDLIELKYDISSFISNFVQFKYDISAFLELIWDQGFWDQYYWAPAYPTFNLVSDIIQLKYDVEGIILVSDTIFIKYDIHESLGKMLIIQYDIAYAEVFKLLVLPYLVYINLE